MEARSLFFATSIIFVAACSSATSSSENLGQADLSLATVPAGIGCVRFVVTPAQDAAVTLNETVSAGGASGSYALGQLPLGDVTFSGSAFSQTCSAVGRNAVPSWVADPVPTTLRAGVPASVSLTFYRNNPVTGAATFVDNLVGLGLGSGSTYGIFGATATSDAVRTWGVNAPIGGPTNVAAISGGGESSCLLTTDGTVWCWGDNTFGELGPNATGYSATPVKVPLRGPATQISCGSTFNCALLGTTDVWCWGDDSQGELVDNASGTGPSTSATPLLVMYGATQVSAGVNHACALTLDAGVAWCWGSDRQGQLGDGTTTGHIASTGTALLQIAAGDTTTCAVRADGAVLCWGFEGYGGLGDGVAFPAIGSVIVPLPAAAAEVATSFNSTCARLVTGAVWCWGTNGSGQSGAGYKPDPSIPSAVTGLSDATHLYGSPSASHFCVTRADLSIACWGENNNGQLGDGTVDTRYTPTPVVE